MRDSDNITEGRNPVIEAIRSGQEIEKIFVQKDLNDGPVNTIIREAKKSGIDIFYVNRERLDNMSETRKHQGVIAYTAVINYAEVKDMLNLAKERNEPPFIIICDGIEDPHNLGAIIRTANLSGAHGVIIKKHHAAGLTSTVAKASAGAINYTLVARVTNIKNTIMDLKKEGLWFVLADTFGTSIYDLDLKGPMGLVIGSEGSGAGSLVKKSCDLFARIPMSGDIDSLNASVACGVIAFEIKRQRML